MKKKTIEKSLLLGTRSQMWHGARRTPGHGRSSWHAAHAPPAAGVQTRVPTPRACVLAALDWCSSTARSGQRQRTSGSAQRVRGCARVRRGRAPRPLRPPVGALRCRRRSCDLCLRLPNFRSFVRSFGGRHVATVSHGTSAISTTPVLDLAPPVRAFLSACLSVRTTPQASKALCWLEI